MLITKKILFQHVGNAPLIPTYSFWGGFPRKLVKLCQGIFPVSLTHSVPLGWVKPLAVYPATSLKNLTR